MTSLYATRHSGDPQVGAHDAADPDLDEAAGVSEQGRR
jgi:hypothetical protein